MNNVTLTIDGKQVTVPQGTTVLNAAKKISVPVPVFCYHGELEPIGACRMCLVEIEKMPKLVISCAMVATEGMVVHTANEKVIKGQKGMLEFLLINHPLDCPVCDKGGECELQDNTFANGPGGSRFIETKRRFVKKDLNQLIRLDMNRCIMCRRCVRTCSDLEGEGVLGVIERGYKSEIAMFSGGDSKCTYCGDCIESCPVGALTSIPFRFKARVWELKRTNTVCTYCADGCRLTLETRDQNILRSRARLTPGEYLSTDHPCVKGHFGHDFVSHPDRLKNPMIRKNGQLTEVGWEEAIEFVANGLEKVQDTYTGSAIGVLGSVRTTTEEQYITAKFAHEVLETDNLDHLLTPKGTFKNGSFEKLISNPAKHEDIVNAQVIVLIGANIETTNPFTRLKIVKAVSQKDAKLITIHPHDVGLHGYVAHELRPKFGTEISAVRLGVSLAKYAFSSQTPAPSTFPFDREAGASTIKEILKEKVNQTAQETGIPVETFIEVAELLANAERRVILFGRDVLSHPQRDQYLVAIVNLVTSLNNLGKGTTKVLWLPEYNNSRGAMEIGLSPKNSGLTFSGMMESAASGKLKAMMVIGENPVLRGLDKNYITENLKKLDFLVVQDLFMTETAELAHAVLPGVSFAEKDGTYITLDGLVQKITSAFPPREEAKPDWWILTELANQLGVEWTYEFVEQITAEIGQTVKGFEKVKLDDLGRDGIYIEYPENGSKFQVQSFKLSNLKSETRDQGLFDLLTGNVLIHSGTMTRYAKVLESLSDHPYVSISRTDAKRLNIKEGQTLIVESDNGSLTLPVVLTKHQAAGTVFIPNNFTQAPVNSLFDKDSESIRVKLKIV
jgi:NADH-quinone oxidoreductase chain G